MSLRRIKALTKKEFIQMRRDIRSLMAALAVPLIMIFLFGYALSLDVDRIPTLVYDQDQTPNSRELIRLLGDSHYFTLVQFIERPAEVDQALIRNEALIALIIPQGFAAAVNEGRRAPVQAILDGSDSNTASIASGYFANIAARYNIQLQAKRIKRAGLKMADMPLELRLRIWFNPEMKSRNFIIPGLSAVLMMTICVLMTSLSVSRERETGTLEQLISTPISSSELLIGKMLPYLAVGLVDLFLIVSTGVWIFGVPLRGSLLDLLLVSFIFLIGTLSWGLFLSVTAKTQLQASQMSMISGFLPSFLLSGFIYPIENMPVALQVITYFIPARYYVEILKGVFLKGIRLDVLWPQVLALCLYAFLVFNLARRKFTKRLF